MPLEGHSTFAQVLPNTDLYTRLMQFIFLTFPGEIDEWKSHISANFTEKFLQKYKEELQDYPEIMERVKL